MWPKFFTAAFSVLHVFMYCFCGFRCAKCAQLSEDFILCDICNQILELDNSIRFAGFANNMGRIIAARYRNKLDPLLTVDESELSFIESVLRMSTRIDMRSKLGKPIYSSTLYEKVKRATILLDNKDLSYSYGVI